MDSKTFALVAALSGIALSSALAGCGNDKKYDFFQTDAATSPDVQPRAGDECLTSASCEDGDRCTESRCVEGACVAIPLPTEECCEAESLLTEDFDDGLNVGIKTSSLNDTAAWSVVGARAVSPPSSLYFGDPSAATYDTGVHVAGAFTLAPMDLPVDREAVLTMRILALIESAPEFDRFTIEADVIEAGVVATTRTLLRKGDLPAGAYTDFALVQVPLADLAGRRVSIRFSFDSMDNMNNAFEGIYIDDLELLATCPIPTDCQADLDCDDGDDCTVDACSAEGCVSVNTCDVTDPDPVYTEEDPCAATDAPADCCVSDDDCEDGNSETVNVCNGATCEVTLNPDLCSAASDCDDGESCTAESCTADGLCEFTGTVGAGCCVASTEAIADFDNGKLQGIYVTDNFETGIFWGTDKTRSTSGQFSLYCGDPVDQTYRADERVKSSATTRALTLSTGGATYLTFDLFKRTSPAKNYDVFQVLVLRDGALLPAWSSKELSDGTTQGAWQRITVPLTQYAGQDVQIRFVFDSVTTPTGLFEGVYIDSLQLETACE